MIKKKVHDLIIVLVIERERNFRLKNRVMEDAMTM